MWRYESKQVNTRACRQRPRLSGGVGMCSHGRVTLVVVYLLVSLAHTVHILPLSAGLSINRSIIPDPDPISSLR